MLQVPELNAGETHVNRRAIGPFKSCISMLEIVRILTRSTHGDSVHSNNFCCTVGLMSLAHVLAGNSLSQYGPLCSYMHGTAQDDAR